MYTELIGTHPNKPTIRVTLFENSMLTYLEGTKPTFREPMPLEEIKDTIINAGYKLHEETHEGTVDGRIHGKPAISYREVPQEVIDEYNRNVHEAFVLLREIDREEEEAEAK